MLLQDYRHGPQGICSYTLQMELLVNSTENMVRRLKKLSCHIEKDSVLYKFGITEFYMNGTAEQLKEGVQKAMQILGPIINIEVGWRSVLDEFTWRIVRFLLENQYIVTEYAPNRFWEIKKVL